MKQKKSKAALALASSTSAPPSPADSPPTQHSTRPFPSLLPLKSSTLPLPLRRGGGSPHPRLYSHQERGSEKRSLMLSLSPGQHQRRMEQQYRSSKRKKDRMENPSARGGHLPFRCLSRSLRLPPPRQPNPPPPPLEKKRQINSPPSPPLSLPPPPPPALSPSSPIPTPPPRPPAPPHQKPSSTNPSPPTRTLIRTRLPAEGLRARA
ncbi:hypothetical protein BCR35DRAFT_192030 [Leucosporidium creatinivorum]|uniref:Uncharacterized protein n=1 Tax=Leucosporidium creatinivorum TaxID=106004 RepID=A0A1Y2FYG3_9BASI|nr:hypothetical protein BCR35DRAFT_192030 [Leucosporidium creatinivorum]